MFLVDEAVADGDTIRDADKFGVGEFLAWADVAVVVEDFDAFCGEVGVELIGGFSSLLSNTDEIDAEWCDGFWPDEAFVVAEFFGDDAHDASDADAV